MAGEKEVEYSERSPSVMSVKQMAHGSKSTECPSALNSTPQASSMLVTSCCYPLLIFCLSSWNTKLNYKIYKNCVSSCTTSTEYHIPLSYVVSSAGTINIGSVESMWFWHPLPCCQLIFSRPALASHLSPQRLAVGTSKYFISINIYEGVSH